jgi:hypothetical protein
MNFQELHDDEFQELHDITKITLYYIKTYEHQEPLDTYHSASVINEGLSIKSVPAC